MANLKAYYAARVVKYKKEAKILAKKKTALSIYRLVVFIIAAFGIYYFFNIWQGYVTIGILGLVVFLKLLVKHTHVKRLYNFNLALVTINEDEINIQAGHFYDRATGSEFQDANHFYSLDIDLFGKGSFFQFINRTKTNEGARILASKLKANNITGIVQRQDAIKELANKSNWRQEYAATSSLVAVTTPAKHIINWLSNYKLFLRGYMAWLPMVFTGISLLLLGLVFFNLVPKSFIGFWLVMGLIITGVFLKKINNLSQKTDRLKDTFRQYALLLDRIEQESFTSTILKEKQDRIKAQGEKASVIFEKLSKAMHALDSRNNLIAAIFGNGLFLLDLKNAYAVEQWIAKYGAKVEDWFQVVSFFDAYNSLGNFAFNHPHFTFPNITDHGSIIEASALGHPMLNINKRVDSDLLIDNEAFFIVTGANMAGKSTFLRSVSLHIVMANVGLPVCANKTNYKPVKLVTSMRTSDSLVDDSSYFFAELTRLKYIVDVIKEEPYFIILDEILKGTNSVDKALGSKKFIEKLVASQATGIIATHDLSLCDIETQLPQVHNYFFDADIINDELHFDYKLKKGVCQKMNASFLLKKMEII